VTMTLAARGSAIRTGRLSRLPPTNDEGLAKAVEVSVLARAPCRWTMRVGTARDWLDIRPGGGYAASCSVENP
jgi:hypothetical protein